MHSRRLSFLIARCLMFAFYFECEIVKRLQITESFETKNKEKGQKTKQITHG